MKELTGRVVIIIVYRYCARTEQNQSDDGLYLAQLRGLLYCKRVVMVVIRYQPLVDAAGMCSIMEECVDRISGCCNRNTTTWTLCAVWQKSN